MRVLVGGERPVRRGRAVGAAGLPARLPEDLVAAEEGEVDAGVARRLDVGALGADQYSSCPLEMKALWLSSSPASARRRTRWCSSRRSRCARGTGSSGTRRRRGTSARCPRDRAVERPVVGDRERALVRPRVAGRAGDVHEYRLLPPYVVVGLPGRVGGLEERSESLASSRTTKGSGWRRPCRRGPASRGRRRRRRRRGRSTTPRPPSCRSRSVPSPRSSGRRAGSGAASPTAGCPPAGAARRCPGSSRGDRRRCGSRGRRLDLEADRPAHVDAHRRRVALDRRVARAGDLPRARGRAGLLVLAGDRVGAGGHACRREGHEHDDRRREGKGDPVSHGQVSDHRPLGPWAC